MKQFKTLLFAAALLVGTVSFTNAQSKVAHINTQELVASMPEMKDAQSQMDQLGKTYEAEIKELATALQNKMKQYDAEAASQTDEENAKRVQEVQGMENNIRQYQANAQKDMQQKRQLTKIYMQKAKAAILKVARAQGFEYVLDSSQGGGVIMADGKDLLADVKTELGF